MEIFNIVSHYVIIIDDYDRVKRHNFIKVITELDADLGFSVIIVEKTSK